MVASSRTRQRRPEAGLNTTWIIFAVDSIQGEGDEAVARLVTTLCAETCRPAVRPAHSAYRTSRSPVSRTARNARRNRPHSQLGLRSPADGALRHGGCGQRPGRALAARTTAVRRPRRVPPQPCCWRWPRSGRSRRAPTRARVPRSPTGTRVAAANVIFTGRIDGDQSDQQTRTITFVVERIYKGDAGSRQVIATSASGASCGLEIGGAGTFLEVREPCGRAGRAAGQPVWRHARRGAPAAHGRGRAQQAPC